jgi:Rab GDP dissociation inhibitor
VTVPDGAGAHRDWNLDLVPNFILSDGNLVKIILKTMVSRYLEWKNIDGTYVF